MATPQILSQLGGGQNPMIAMIRQAKTMLGAMQNPQAALTQIVNQNPIVNQTIRQYGGVEGAITALCNQKGINVQEFMDALK